MSDKIRRTILIVEHHQNLVDFLRGLLEERGYAVITAATIAEARERLADGPDAILLDSTLPDGAGISFLRELRRTSDVPVIMSTAGYSEEAQAREAGCDDFIEKPYMLDMVIARIEKRLFA